MQEEFRQAERCLNNASEHFIKLGSEPSEAAVLRVLADLYQKRGDQGSAARCLERTIQIDIHYHLPEQNNDKANLAKIRGRQNEPLPLTTYSSQHKPKN